MADLSNAFVADPELVAELQKRSAPVSITARPILFRQGEKPSAVYLIRGGEVLLTGRGDDIFTIRAGAGSLLGIPAVIGSKPYSLTAEALPGSQVEVVTGDDFVHLMQANPGLAFHVLQILASEVRMARAALAHASS